MASPESAQSPWVGREIGWWREHRPVSHVLIAVTGGELVWDASAGDLDWAVTTALSKEALGHAFGQEPRWVDLRWARAQEGSLRPPTHGSRTPWPTWPRPSARCPRTR